LFSSYPIEYFEIKQKSLRIKSQTRFEIGNVSGQNLLINPILINDKTSETLAGKIKKLTDEFGQ
jgi:hypothetical protein